jgi:threonine synthase
MASSVTLVCAGCGTKPEASEPYPFVCPAARDDDDIDHVVAVELDTAGLRFEDDDPNPFVRFRQLLYPYQLARARGMADEEYIGIVQALDEAVKAVDGIGFTLTPLDRQDELSERLGIDPTGGVWIKDETGNVSGSHKGRHLMGLLIYLEVIERLGLIPGGAARDLAIASCGNAALAAAILAEAAGRKLEIFVPEGADPAILARLKERHAVITSCAREEGVVGDPAYLRLKVAIGGGALPFTCQGPDNGLTIDGGKTIAYELASQLAREETVLDRIFVQVGGGALGSALIQGLRNSVALGVLPALPRIHCVQTEGAAPLHRAYRILTERVARRLSARGVQLEGVDGGLAQQRRSPDGAGAVELELKRASRHRSEFMWPWEQEPASVAYGILDDEAYDWMALVRGMLESGGWPLVVSEATLHEANHLARSATHIDVDHTGSSGLAGLMSLRSGDDVPSDERVGVLFTGTRR